MGVFAIDPFVLGVWDWFHHLDFVFVVVVEGPIEFGV